tara:strand:- start:569 stop:709 length:141 start_codon:yes stop_codon:yes gene_type:complete
MARGDKGAEHELVVSQCLNGLAVGLLVFTALAVVALLLCVAKCIEV